MYRPLALLALLLLPACEPPTMTYPEAIAFCQDRARSAAGPRGEAIVGVGSQGPRTQVGLSFDQNFLMGRDPNVVYTECLNNLRANGQIVGGPVTGN